MELQKNTEYYFYDEGKLEWVYLGNYIGYNKNNIVDFYFWDNSQCLCVQRKMGHPIHISSKDDLAINKRIVKINRLLDEV